MRIRSGIPLVMIGIFCGSATAEDLLTRSIRRELKEECNDAVAFAACADALALHGQGKEDDALAALTNLLPPGAAARTHYKIAVPLADDGFWKQVALAGAQPLDCRAKLPEALEWHFDRDPKALAKAADDSGTNAFRAVADLFESLAAIGVAPDERNREADVYRYCFFNDPSILFGAVKKALGR